MVFLTFFHGRLWEICEGRQMIVHQRLTTFVSLFVIRAVFSSEIEQAPKTAFAEDLEKERTGPLSLQLLDGSMVRDGKMRFLLEIELLPTRSFWGGR